LNDFVSLICKCWPFLITFQIKTLAKKIINCCFKIHTTSKKNKKKVLIWRVRHKSWTSI